MKAKNICVFQWERESVCVCTNSRSEESSGLMFRDRVNMTLINVLAFVHTVEFTHVITGKFTAECRPSKWPSAFTVDSFTSISFLIFALINLTLLNIYVRIVLHVGVPPAHRIRWSVNPIIEDKDLLKVSNIGRSIWTMTVQNVKYQVLICFFV